MSFQAAVEHGRPDQLAIEYIIYMSTYSTGDRVAHAQYGDGIVSSVNQYHTVIEFDAHGSRTFASPRVVLTPSTTPPPEKPAKRKAAARKKKA